jgi:hypothetical protein
LLCGYSALEPGKERPSGAGSKPAKRVAESDIRGRAEQDCDGTCHETRHAVADHRGSPVDSSLLPAPGTAGQSTARNSMQASKSNAKDLPSLAAQAPALLTATAFA